jgi:hypothetical protein
MSTFAGIILALTLAAAGCERLSVSRLQPSALPPSDALAPRPVTTYTTKTPQPRPQAAPGAVVEHEPRPQLSSEPASTSAADASSTAATPLLDAALQRAQAVERAGREPQGDDNPAPTPIPAQPETADSAPGPATGAEPPSESKDTSESGPGALPKPLPQVAPADVIPSLPPDVTKIDPKAEASAPLNAERADARDGADPSRPIDPERPVVTGEPRDVWHEGLERLRSVARDHTEMLGGESHDLWMSRSRLLDYLDEPESLSLSEEASFRHTILTAMAVTTGPEPAEPSARSAPIRAAIEALEGYAPLEIVELQLCRKVKGFGDFEPLEATACRPGHGVIMYCELAGVSYAPEGPLYRSRLASRVEVVVPAGGKPVWSHTLGTADDVCRRRRRDFYVNYRITLPEALAPGSYELRLIQDDLVANHSATRAIPLVIQP